MQKSSYDMVDFLKLIGAIMILAMHSNAFGDINCLRIAWECCSRWAVPFFFMVSSFFLCGKIKDSNDYNQRYYAIIAYTKRILVLYGLWALINLPSIIVSRIYVKGPFDILTYLLFLKGLLLSSTFTGSWYLVSSIVSAWLCYWVFRHLSIKKKLVITGMFQIICILCSVYLGVLPEQLGFFLNKGLLFPLNVLGGGFYFVIGEVINYKVELIETIKNRKLFVGLLLFAGLYFFEIYIAKNIGVFHSTDFGVFTAPASLCVVLLALKSSIIVKHHRAYRKLSTIIYCSQSNILYIPKVIERLGFRVDSYFFRFLLVAICSAMICIIVLKLQQSRKYKWAKHLT